MGTQKKMSQEGSNKLTIGWREWVALPNLGINGIKAKIDTGARTSSIHAFSLEPFTAAGKDKVRFSIHPLQHNTEIVQICEADICDFRWVSDSGGHHEKRYVIKTLLVIGNLQKEIEITLTNRDTMKFRMLLGRTALKKIFLIDPTISYTQGKL
jgi:hypothetical protein